VSDEVIEQVEVAPREGMQGAWTVEAIGSDGEIYQAIFLGPEAESRAHEYARLKYGVTRPQPRHR
jgi:hypothetical protein